ncbi:MAG: hypothetical protein QOK29_1598 [Rhodospirillaceae bacterium]|jgi:hypothetical protein|nr:hypothetical protein [Rhodospirillaceae bacterium]
MNRHLRARFWLEVAGASVSVVSLGMTLIWPSWIELVFHIDPDRGSGLLEWFIVVASLTVSVCTSVMARHEWRRRVTLSAQLLEGKGRGSGKV